MLQEKGGQDVPPAASLWPVPRLFDETARSPVIAPEEFRRGLFAMRTRRFGKVAEMLIQKMIGAASPRNQFHDLYDDLNRLRVEVKISAVNEQYEEPVSRGNLLDAIRTAAKERAVPFDEWESHRFDCNIQQVKPAQFDTLYYGLLFSDRVILFRMASTCLGTDPAIRFSDKQHKGNVGEGQFHLNNLTLAHHLQTYSFASMDHTGFVSLLFAEPSNDAPSSCGPLNGLLPREGPPKRVA